MRSPLYIITFFFMSFTADCVDPEGPVLRLYAMKGKTVPLSLGNQQHNATGMKWRKNQVLIATVESNNPKVKDMNKHDIQYNGALIIRNVTEEDSGHYRAEEGQWEATVIKYHLTVQEAVSDPVISTSPVQSNSSADVCHASVNCSSDGDTAVYDCDLQRCTLKNFSLANVTINVTVTDNGMVRCVSSNHVSSKATTSPMNITCSKKDTALVSTTADSILALITVLTCLMMFVLLGLYLVIRNYYSRKKLPVDNTHPVRDINTVYGMVQKCRPPPQNCATNCPAVTVYDVPSKCVRAHHETSDQMQVIQERPLEEQTRTAHADAQEKTEDTQLTVYWTLGQKF